MASELPDKVRMRGWVRLPIRSTGDLLDPATALTWGSRKPSVADYSLPQRGRPTYTG